MELNLLPEDQVMKIDEIIRSNRKTFALEIKPDGRLIVRAPKRASQKQIQSIVDQKTEWIIKNKAKVSQKYAALKPKRFEPGESFWYLGEQYPLQLTNRQKPLLTLDGAFHLARKAQNQAKAVFIEWYREETRAITQDMIKSYTGRYQFKVGQVRINSARTRWGSCSSKNNLNFTYRLCMAPLSVVEYVVVHELAHLKERNHSKAFWNTVAALKPDYQQDRQWLKQYGHLLTLE
jgi:predicted metal-dependent hydrolase